jgi:Zn-dependent M28 family amino/carboxypeptidase
LLVVSLLFGWIVGGVILNSYEAFLVMFMVAYYGLFFGIMRGFKNKNNYNDNTSGVATILSIIDELSKDALNEVAFILFDNEEKGKKGSAVYFKDHKDEMKERFLINFDCVGNGENIIFIAQEGAINSQEFKQLKGTFENSDEFTLDFCTHKEAQSNSDHKNFPCGVACIACKKSKNGILYTPNIHTNKDVIAYNSNIDYIAKNIVLFIDNI